MVWMPCTVEPLNLGCFLPLLFPKSPVLQVCQLQQLLLTSSVE